MEEKEKGELGLSLNLLVKTSFIVFIGVFLSKILSYALRIIVFRHYGTEVYGLFSLAAIIFGWFVSVSALGLFEGLLRYIPQFRGKKQTSKIRYIVRFAFILTTFTSILAGIILFFGSGFIAETIFHNPALKVYLQIFAITVPFTVLSNPFLATLRGYEKINAYSFIFNIVQNAGEVIILGILILIGFNSTAVPLSYLIGMIIMCISSYLVCKYKISEVFVKPTIKKNDKKEVYKSLLHYSIPLLFYGIFFTIFYWIDSFSIGYFKSAAEVGIYNTAVPIALLLGVVPDLFMQLFFPLINREYAKKKIELIRQLSKQVTKWIFVFNLPIFLLIAIFPGAPLNILFGPQALAAQDALRILAVAALFNSVFVISNSLLSMAGKSKLILMDIIIAAILNFALNYIFVPMHSILGIDNAAGINGAAIATLISVIVFNSLFFFQAKHYLGIIPLRRKMINALLMAVISATLLIYVKSFFSNNITTVAILAIGFIIVYFTLVIITKGLDENDMRIIKSIKTKVVQSFNKK